jgi:hypothetical protein
MSMLPIIPPAGGGMGAGRPSAKERLEIRRLLDEGERKARAKKGKARS